MLSKILYYLILKPLSFLPLPVLYLFSNFMYFILYYIIGYRKKVVLNNLSNSFPEKTNAELYRIRKKFYAHFCDVIVESVRLFSMSEEEAKRRCKCRTPELLNQYYDKGQSVLLGCGHYNNWELTGVSFEPQVKHQTMCPYTPLSSAFFDDKMRESRSKYGVFLISKKEIKNRIENYKEKPFVIVFGTDQNPSARKGKLFWTRFLNQDTAVNFGMEKLAVDYGLPVLFMKIHKIKRGYYEYDFEVVENNPKESVYGFITEKHTQILENQIIEHPEFWLWTHKRWKRKKEE